MGKISVYCLLSAEEVIHIRGIAVVHDTEMAAVYHDAV